MKTVAVEFSYPSSPNAERFRKPHGCYTVAIIDNAKPSKAISAFDTVEEAIASARQIGLPFNRYSLA